MDKIIINGGIKLHGEVCISGAKNAALPILFSSLLTDDTVLIQNVPTLVDIDIAIAFLKFIGKKVIRKRDSVIISFSSSKYNYTQPYELVSKMRASILIMGPLLARVKKVNIYLPGGCDIGARPIDMHLKAFETLGADVSISRNFIKAYVKREMKGTTINFRVPSVGATENVLLAATLSNGITTIINAAFEPEVIDLINILNKMGAKILTFSPHTIVVQGVSKLHGVTHCIIPDRVEAATYMIAAAITKGDIVLKQVNPSHLYIVKKKLQNSGLFIKEDHNTIYAKWVRALTPQNISTSFYPGFPTDIQAQWMTLMCLIKGTSYIKENVFENRFLHVNELKKFGAHITINDKIVSIQGVKNFIGASVIVSDLRAGAALILAGLAARGRTILSSIHHLDRGYDSFEYKLSNLHAKILRVHE
ncbi:MAG: UDP-N-acetylglucosamine 1-carboxyvinyltransferase [Endomicrobium sp.]|jgi:UDP-N-acetylglucosamine 1-carboxyvinyltransferase|nr:UDP-N-acetylglucosamine 1-carboxyvinyltransferase [Endomicrobium sp.]